MSSSRSDAAAAFAADSIRDGNSPDDYIVAEARRVAGLTAHVIEDISFGETVSWLVCKCGYSPRSRTPEGLDGLYSRHVSGYKLAEAA